MIAAQEVALTPERLLVTSGMQTKHRNQKQQGHPCEMPRTAVKRKCKNLRKTEVSLILFNL